LRAMAFTKTVSWCQKLTRHFSGRAGEKPDSLFLRTCIAADKRSIALEIPVDKVNESNRLIVTQTEKL
jgi:hypothetical protein